jgi:hypothetical protein|tara:strand:- start:1558 stop:1716 length:159 start_codon:yes stop_codon:yes gene_type:complete
MMQELFIGIITMICLYVMGRFLYPDEPQRPIQRERIKTDFLYGVEYKLEEDE